MCIVKVNAAKVGSLRMPWMEAEGRADGAFILRNGILLIPAIPPEFSSNHEKAKFDGGGPPPHRGGIAQAHDGVRDRQGAQAATGDDHARDQGPREGETAHFFAGLRD